MQWEDIATSEDFVNSPIDLISQFQNCDERASKYDEVTDLYVIKFVSDQGWVFNGAHYYGLYLETKKLSCVFNVT